MSAGTPTGSQSLKAAAAWAPKPLPLLLGAMAWLAYWSLPAPEGVPGPVMVSWQAVNFTAAAASAGLMGPAAKPCGIALIAVVSFVGVAAATNGHSSAALFLLLTQGLLAAGAALIGAALPARLRPVKGSAA